MTLQDQLTEAEKQWQQAIAQAAYHQGRVDTLRALLAADHAPPDPNPPPAS